MNSETNKFVGKIGVYPEVCCEYCEEIVHNHLNCPVCKKLNAESDNYHSLNETYNRVDGYALLTCECGAMFRTKSDPYDLGTIWEQFTTE